MTRMPIIFEDETDNNEEWISMGEDNDNTWILYDDNNGEDEDNQLTSHHQEPEEFKDLDWNDVPNFICQLNYNHLKGYERHQVEEENRTILSSRRRLVAKKAIIRLPYKGTSFYIASEKDFQQKEVDYMNRTGAYKWIHTLDDAHSHVSETCLVEMIEQVERILDDLLDSNCIHQAQHMIMTIVRSSIRMHYLYFVPETHKENIPVRPIFVCNDGPTINIVRYITPLLWSIFDRATNCKRFSNGAIDVIHAIEHDGHMGHFQSPILFVTFNLDDLINIFPHDETIIALNYLLREQLPDQRIAGLTVDTILQLVQLVLKTQFYVYNAALYQQIHGGASGLPLTMFLAYTYLFFGQYRELVKNFTKKNEFFGSYTNKGTLESKVYYDPNIVDTLPNVSNELMENATKQLYAVLYRAVRCCSDVEKFHSELLYIQ
ncbi:unnamed protein product, partial [Rotaria sordida]